jgi:hypothetical protein
VTHSLRSDVAKDGNYLADLYGHLPGYWMHPSFVLATFEKNIAKWNGVLLCFVLGPHNQSDARCLRTAHRPTDQGSWCESDKKIESRCINADTIACVQN